MRPAMLVFGALCLWASVSLVSHAQPSAARAPFPAAAWAALAHGDRAEAARLAGERPADDPAAAAILAQLDTDRGRYDEALAILRPAASRTPLGDAALHLGLLLQYLGRRDEALPLLTAIQARSGDDARSRLRAGRAAAALGLAREANSLFRAAAAAGPDPALDAAWGRLFLDKYNRTEAVKSFRQAIAADPRWAPAHAGLARALADDDPPAAEAAAAAALAIDPHLADAELLLAENDLDDSRYDAAATRLARVLEWNPRSLEAIALRAAVHYVRGDRPGFDADASRASAINPSSGETWRAAASLAARNYRFDEAAALAQHATTVEPASARAHAELGMHLMRTGDERGARAALDRAFRIDPYDVVTYNLLALLDTLDKFVEVREGDIVLKLHPDEAPVMREYAMPLAQEALRTLSARYGFTPRGPILVEMFPRHDDFAVRTLGLPGMLGALGACFGRVVTLDSPRAREPGSFSWQATLWHEMTHVITLQMSNQRIPRWLTEGISEYEEARARPDWGREMEVPFARALEAGKALKLADLNAGFTRPDSIALAYFEASLLVDHIVRTFGEEKLQALVRSYATGLEGSAAIERSLGTSLEHLQGSFDGALDARFGALRAALREPAGGEEARHPAATGRGAAPVDLEALRREAASRPGSYAAQLALGRALAAAGDRAAFGPLEKAAALVPITSGPDGPHALMAALAEQLGDPVRAMAEYEAVLAVDHTTVEAARRLAALAGKAGSSERLLLAHTRIVAIDPFDPVAHAELGRLALGARQADVAIREFRASLALGPADRASAHCDLAEALLLAKRPSEARAEVLAALEIAPSYERAQELLLRLTPGAAAAGPT